VKAIGCDALLVARERSRQRKRSRGLRLGYVAPPEVVLYDVFQISLAAVESPIMLGSVAVTRDAPF